MGGWGGCEGWDIGEEALKTGLEGAKLPGRFQLLSASESEQMGADGAAVVVDGGERREGAGETQVLPRECAYIVCQVAHTQHSPHRGIRIGVGSESERTLPRQVAHAGVGDGIR